MDTNLPTIAGFISTALFALCTLPMLTKAFRTKNLASYSLGNILISNVGNLIYPIYVFQLPPGPVWYLQYEGLPHKLQSIIGYAIRHARTSAAAVAYAAGQPTAKDNLQARYARGEITREEFELRKQDIG